MGHSWDALGDSWTTSDRLFSTFGTKKLLKRRPGRVLKSCFFEDRAFSRNHGKRKSRATFPHRKCIHVRRQNRSEIEVVSILRLGCAFSLPWGDFWGPLGHFWSVLGRFGEPRVPQEPPKSTHEQPRASQEHPKSTPRAPQEHPKSPPKPPRRISRCPKSAQVRF